MPRGDAETVRAFMDGWAASDLDRVLECSDPEIHFDWTESIGPFNGTYRGHAGMTRFWTDTWEAWDSFTPRLDDVVETATGHVATAVVVTGRGKGSGVDVAARGGTHWTVRDGKVVAAKMFQTPEEALAAARAAA